MQLPENLVELCNKYVHSNTVWFPICYSLNENKPAIVSPGNGEWRNAGKGMFAATKSQFTKVGKYDETFRDWGEEDWDLWLRFYKNGIYPARTKCQGLFHHYHPSVSGSSSSKN